MEKIYKGVSIYQVKTNKIDELSQIVCVNLDVGDIVIELKDGEELAYLVSSKTSEKMVLTSNSNGSTIEIVYEVNDEGKWEYSEAETSKLSFGYLKIELGDITNLLDESGTLEPTTDDEKLLYSLSKEAKLSNKPILLKFTYDGECYIAYCVGCETMLSTTFYYGGDGDVYNVRIFATGDNLQFGKMIVN